MRPLTVSERALLDKLLSIDFPGKSELRLQLHDAVVEPIDENGSLRFNIVSDGFAPVMKRIPVEAECQDLDGMTIHALLHVIQGKASELEIYKDDSSRLIKFPAAEQWEPLVQWN